MIRSVLFITIILLSAYSAKSQLNTSNDSIVLEFDPGQAIYYLDNEIDENSGLIFYDDLFWTINDSDGEPIIYGLNTKNGDLKKKIRISNAVNVDWEDLCQDEQYIFIGDFGNNAGNRDNLRFYRINKSEIKDIEYQEIKADIIDFFYEDQLDFSAKFRKTDYDCEAALCLDSSIYIFTKDWILRETKLYKIRKLPGKQRAELMTSFKINGLVTAAGISPDKKYLAVLGYKDYTPFLWIFSNFEEKNFFEGERIRIEMPAIHRAQTEAIVFKNNDSLYFSCEKSVEKTLILFNTVVFPQQMFVMPVSFWEEYFSSKLDKKNKHSLKINNE